MAIIETRHGGRLLRPVACEAARTVLEQAKSSNTWAVQDSAMYLDAQPKGTSSGTTARLSNDVSYRRDSPTVHRPALLRQDGRERIASSRQLFRPQRPRCDEL
jgi:hypothetical protein